MAPLIFGSIAFLHNYTDSTARDVSNKKPRPPADPAARGILRLERSEKIIRFRQSE